MPAINQHALDLGLLLQAVAFADNDPKAALAYCEGNFHRYKDSRARVTIKNAVDALSTGGQASALAAARSMDSMLLPLIRDYTLLDRMSFARQAPLNISIPAFTGDLTANEVAEGQPKPLGKFALATVNVTPKKIAGAFVITNDVLKLSDPAGVSMLGTELAKAVVAKMDVRFADPNLGGSISNGATTISSGGTTLSAIDADLKSAMNALTDSGDEALSTATWCMSSKVAIYLSTLRGSGGNPAFPQIGARGGVLFGLPVLVSNALSASGSPNESAVLLVCQDQILVGDQGAATVRAITQGDAQLTDTPTSAATTLQSLWQNNLVAFLGERWVGWSRRDSNSVVVIDNLQVG